MSTKTAPKKLQFKSVNDFLVFWSGASHGGFDINDISKEQIQMYKENHEKELISATMHFPTLCIVLNKSLV